MTLIISIAIAIIAIVATIYGIGLVLYYGFEWEEDPIEKDKDEEYFERIKQQQDSTRMPVRSLCELTEEFYYN